MTLETSLVAASIDFIFVLFEKEVNTHSCGSDENYAAKDNKNQSPVSARIADVASIYFHSALAIGELQIVLASSACSG